jgi:hypothetical protein
VIRGRDPDFLASSTESLYLFSVTQCWNEQKIIHIHFVDSWIDSLNLLGNLNIEDELPEVAPSVYAFGVERGAWLVLAEAHGCVEPLLPINS